MSSCRLGQVDLRPGFEHEGFARLSTDEEAWRRGFQSQSLPDPVAQAVEQGLRSRLVHLLSEGRDVVVDLSFWSRVMREDYRRLARSCGVVAETVYFATPREVVLERVRARAGASPNEVRLSEQQVTAYIDAFEVPTVDEGPCGS